MLLYTMALTWIEKSDRYCWNNFSQSFITQIATRSPTRLRFASARHYKTWQSASLINYTGQPNSNIMNGWTNLNHDDPARYRSRQACHSLNRPTQTQRPNRASQHNQIRVLQKPNPRALGNPLRCDHTAKINQPKHNHNVITSSQPKSASTATCFTTLHLAKRVA